MKLNWGSGIAIFYTLFVVTMVYMVVRASQADINMVQDNYYDQDINYEAFRKSRQNGMEEGSLFIEYQSGQEKVKIQFPEETVEIDGSVQLYRPSNQSWDKNLEIEVDESNAMEVAVGQLAKGYWKIVVRWDSRGKSYYKEQPLIL